MATEVKLPRLGKTMERGFVTVVLVKAGDEIKKGDHPADAGGELSEDDLEDEQGGGDTEGDDVGEGVELAAEGAFVAAEAGEAAVEHIENKGAEDPEQAGFIGSDPVAVFGGGLHEAALDDLEDGHEATEEISRGHEAGEEIGRALGRGQLGAVF